MDTREHILETGLGLIANKGFTAVGLSELLQAAGVPKGSFYHYFASKEAFGEALLEAYFADYFDRLDAVLAGPGSSAAARLMTYWSYWLETQSSEEMKKRCLVVKLTAEVSDLSETMRIVLQRGTAQIIERLAHAIADGLADGSLVPPKDPEGLATLLYHLWLGASLRAKMTRDRVPLEAAYRSTLSLLEVVAPVPA